MNCLRFRLHISADEYLKYYSGQARSVSVMSEDGCRIEFPAEHLRSYVTSNGIDGYFEICFDENRRFQQLRQL
ncbi:MAG: DUF2835 domain-containing protein [Thioalkalispiraceae bacterium]|jgi:hypothetical protein